ncbi:MAG: hypothetical protein MK078_00605 [Crocinitomicaceae bacterium]|nr:hypothetical protein [Crocinitomicaceae bacterium]
MKVFGFIGFGLAVLALVLALVNFFELLPFADSISHLQEDPYYSLWVKAMRLTKNGAIIAVIIGSISTLISAIYYFLERKYMHAYGLGFSVIAILISIPLFF